MKTIIIRGIVILLLVVASFLAMRENRKPERPPPPSALSGEVAEQPAVPEGGYRDPIQFFIYILFVAISLGVIALKWVIPALGDRVAESFYSAPEKTEQTETQKAMALVAQGEYHKALAAFGKILEQNPNDRFAVVESAKIYQGKLGDVDSAVEVLEKAVAGEWPEDDKCFFLLKLADIHSTDRGDFGRARELLDQLIQQFPESRHAGNANHKLREIEEQEFLAKRQTH
jgi:tetratricopeptide (TPR) repeat protein